jgi:hypothetical protein
MSFLPLLLKFWREALIFALLASTLGAAQSCRVEHAAVLNAKQDVEDLKASDERLAQEQKANNAKQAEQDQLAKQETVNEYQSQLDILRSDLRVASIRVCNDTRRSSAVPTARNAGPETTSQTPAELPQPTNRDIGPDIDRLTREADELAAQCSSLIDFVERTTTRRASGEDQLPDTNH